MPRNRPSAFEVSFPGEYQEGDIPMANNVSMNRGLSIGSTGSSSSGHSLGKRKDTSDGQYRDPRLVKRKVLPTSRYYQKKLNEVEENRALVLPGEDTEDQDAERDLDEKPIRELRGFCIFDPKHGNEYVTLEALEEDDGVDRQFEAAGTVAPYFVSDEDEGQEDGEADQTVFVRLSSILRYTINYTQESEPFFIETQYAWYILRKPSHSYIPFFEHFYTPRRVAQIFISSALSRPNETYEAFKTKFELRVDMFGKSYYEKHIMESIEEIRKAVQEEPEYSKIMAVPFVKTVMRKAPSNDMARPMKASGPKWTSNNRALSGNLDLAVLKKENQNQTCVTVRIGKLIKGLVREQILLLASKSHADSVWKMDARSKEFKDRSHRILKRLVANAGTKKKSFTRKQDRVSVIDDTYSAIEIEGKRYQTGDIIIIPNPDAIADLESKKLYIDRNSKIYDYFWFALFLYVRPELLSGRVHLQWFEHGSKTVLGELAHPQELFLTNSCGEHPIDDIVGKATVHFGVQRVAMEGPLDFFCKFMHDRERALFTSINMDRKRLFDQQQAPNNCPVCPMAEQQLNDTEARKLKDDDGNPNGVAYGGMQYHLEDFVLYRADKGPANIGYIKEVTFDQTVGAKVKLRKVGRMSQLEDLPPNFMKDERELYLTKEVHVVPPKELLQVIFAPCAGSFSTESTIEDWLELSPDHYYTRYRFPRLKPRSWDDRKLLKWEKYHVCSPCYEERLKRKKDLNGFFHEAKPLKTLDLFGGVGAFSLGIAQGTRCMKVTHAIEISPSAAMTFARNSPETIVYNQCANEMLRYIVKFKDGHDIDIPKQKYDGKTPIKPPPKQGEIDVITAGFPCQSHSTLNMYKETDDVKSNLIMTTLSYVDFYAPKYVYFENVPGFYRFGFKTAEGQENDHEIKSGTDIEMGGLKLIIRALIDMNYQVQFGSLQAAHYGTPQRRLRFFLVAAKHDEVLPELPQPTHDFDAGKSLEIKYENKESAKPIRTVIGTALHPVVTIKDAIDDLPLFDWKHPKPLLEKERARKRSMIVSFACKKGDSHSGFEGRVDYGTIPRTRYQQEARRKETLDIQHYTKCLLPEKVERVLNIPLVAGADYRSLPPNLSEWGFIDPTSSVGRLCYRPGIYGRLDAKGVFPTTVTNVDPTAKQSQCLHPKCHRMITVRELARSQGFPDWFVFKAIDNNVVTMHRQIGNAVPIPVAYALGRQLRDSLFEKWKIEQETKATRRDDVTMIDDIDDADEGTATPRAPTPANVVPVYNDDYDMDDMYADY